MDLEEEIKTFTKLLEALYLPALKYDLDNIPIQHDSFKEYIENIEQSLPVFYDLIQKQKQLILQNKEVQSSLISLLCELTAPDTIFQLENKRLLENAHRLLDNIELDVEVEEHLFNYYRKKLNKVLWKRNLGSVHGFVQFLQHFYNKKHTNNERNLNNNWLTFCLSIALTIRDCHLVTYKQLGIKIFIIILTNGKPEDIRNLNLHSVIYESTFKDVHILDDAAHAENIWNCLYTCLDFFENIDSMNWCQVDDLLEILIRNIPLTSKNDVSLCLFGYITKLCAFFTLNRNNILKPIDIALNEEEESSVLKDYRNECATNTSYTIFRWAKSILDMIIFECYKLMQDVDNCLNLLKAMHKCFMVSILPIPLPIIEPHLIIFYEKFIAVLMEVIVTHKKQKNIIKQTKAIIDTFIWQLNQSSYHEENTKFPEFLKAFEQLRQHKVFVV